jgi:hypothetical protein
MNRWRPALDSGLEPNLLRDFLQNHIEKPAGYPE